MDDDTRMYYYNELLGLADSLDEKTTTQDLARALTNLATEVLS